MTSLLDTQVFIFSSSLENPDRFFQGYCFKGNDFVFGQGGADARFAATGEDIGAGEDGCYVSVVRENNSFVFRIDFSGNKKLFYYWDYGFWAVSNSLPILIGHLQKNGLPVAPNHAQLAAAGCGKGSSALNQLTSYETVANGIRLAPLKAELVIGDQRLGFRRSRRAPRHQYLHALETYLRTWTGRLATLLAEPNMSLNCDLTGGGDSRTVFAMLMHARSYTCAQASLRAATAASKAAQTDMEIASELCHRFDVPHNGPRAPNPHTFSRAESYASWRQLCLGSYFPIYFPGAAPYSHRISFGGGGGENHRPFYRSEPAEEFCRNRARKIEPSWLRQAFSAEMLRTFNVLASLDGPDADPLVSHYRHFRNRLHSGRTSQYGVQFLPLGSHLLEQAADAAGQARLSRGQLNYDIMASTEPDLLSFRFDSPEKSPSPEVLSALQRIDTGLPTPGRVYCEPPMEQRSKASSPSQWKLLEEELDEACRSSFIKSFWPADFIAETRKAAGQASIDGRLPHARDGQPIAAILTSSLF